MTTQYHNTHCLSCGIPLTSPVPHVICDVCSDPNTDTIPELIFRLQEKIKRLELQLQGESHG